MAISVGDEATLAAKFAVMRSSLDERAWRACPGTEACALGYGGIGARGASGPRGVRPAPAARLPGCPAARLPGCPAALERIFRPYRADRGWNERYGCGILHTLRCTVPHPRH